MKNDDNLNEKNIFNNEIELSHSINNIENSDFKYNINKI